MSQDPIGEKTWCFQDFNQLPPALHRHFLKELSKNIAPRLVAKLLCPGNPQLPRLVHLLTIETRQTREVRVRLRRDCPSLGKRVCTCQVICWWVKNTQKPKNNGLLKGKMSPKTWSPVGVFLLKAIFSFSKVINDLKPQALFFSLTTYHFLTRKVFFEHHPTIELEILYLLDYTS